MQHYGDITKIKGAEVPIVDVVTGGSPCQDLSVAGKRAGLAGERSGLFMEQIRVIKEMRDEDKRLRPTRGADEYIRPRYMVWENVPGAFSSNKGEDFRAVLEETAKVVQGDACIPGPPGGKWPYAGCIMGDGWSIAWRLHDAQFWGVPQRRKRIALVADFGGATAPEILFEREGVSRDIEESREEGQGIATDIARCVDETGRIDEWLNAVNKDAKHQQDLLQSDLGISRTLAPGTHASGSHLTKTLITNGCLNPASYTLKIRGGVDTDSSGKKAGKGPLVQTELSATLGVSQDQTLITRCLNPWDVQSKHVQPENGIAESLYAGECRGGGGESYVMQQKVFGICSDGSNSMRSDNPHAGIYEADTTRTLDMNGGNPACNQGGMIVVEGVDGYNQTTTGVKAMSLTSGRADDHHIPCVVIEGNGSRPSHKVDGYAEGEIMYTLNSTEHHAVAVESHAQDARYNVREVNQPLSANMEHDPANGGLVMAVENHPNDSRVKISEDGKIQTLSSRMGTGGGNVPMVMEQHTFANVAACRNAQDGRGGVHSQMMDDPEGNFVLDTVTASKATFFTGTHQDGVAETLVAQDPGEACQSVVRRLTPLECERLQGFPDHWTDIGDWVDSKGKKHKGESDSPRYKALGNSIALPFWKWMAKRMRNYLGDKPTMASLFSGIGGFELSYLEAGVKPMWASEIEEFPIAVTKIRFPDIEDDV